MDLLKAIFSVPGIRGEIALYAKGQSGGARFVTLDEVTTYLGEKDWYFHLATHDKNLIKPGGRGSVNSSQNFTTLWCDLDIAEKDYSYATIQEVQNLIQQLTKLHLQPSALVHSGNGLHLYWLLDKPEETKKYPSACKAWIIYIKQVLEQVANREIKLDQVGDMARILRLPGTIHSAKGKLVRCLLLDESRRYDLETLLSYTSYHQRKERGTGKTAVKNKLLEAMGNIKSHVPSFTSNIIYSCEQVKDFFRRSGDVSEPLWYSMAGLLPYTDDGLDYFMNLSQQSTIDPMSKVEQWRNSSDGPATCQKFYDVNPSICQACPHFKRITTPLQLGYSKPVKVEQKEQPVQPSNGTFVIQPEHHIDEYIPPQPFAFDKNGAICATVEDSSGANRTKVICHNRVVPYKRIWSEEENQEVIYFNIFTPNDGWRETDVPLSSLQGSCPAMSKLMGAGALIVNNHSSLMTNYLTGCVKYMQDLKQVNTSYARIGWRNPEFLTGNRDTDDRFVLGDVTVYMNGEVRQESLIPDLKKDIKDIGMKGDINQWRQAISILSKPGFEKHLICFMGAFAVPLFRATDYHGLVVNMLSRQSGTFKSFTLKMISSVYGKPLCDHILNRDSEKSVYAKIANRCDLPITYDEITNISKEALSDLAYAVTQGRRANRLNQDSSLKVNESVWRTIMFSSSNSSLDDMLRETNLAERMRILELPISAAEVCPSMTDSEARNTMDILSNNYGQAGLLWVKYIVDNRDLIFKECDQMISELTTMSKARSDKRFWISYLAFVLVAAKHTRLLGIHSFDINSIALTARSILDSSSSKVESDQIPLPMYAQQYLSENLDSTLTVVYNSIAARRGEMKREPRSNVTIKIEEVSNGPAIRTRIAYISTRHMQQYLMEMRVSYDDFIKELINTNVLVDQKTIKRVTIPGSPETFRLTCFSVDIDKLDELYMTKPEAIDKQNTVL